MMKKIYLVLCFACLALSGLKADEFLAEIKIGYMRPTDKRFKDVYNGSGVYGAEISSPILDRLHLWGSVDYFVKMGKSLGLGHSTRLSLTPFAIGFKYFYSIWKFDFYIGGGVQYTRLKTKDFSSFIIKNVSKWNTGGIVKAGTLIHFDCGLFMDIFADYSNLKMHFHSRTRPVVTRHDPKLNTWSVGVGIGYRFPTYCYK